MKSLEKRFKDIFDEYNELPDDAMRFKLDVLRVQEFTEELLKAVEDYYSDNRPMCVLGGNNPEYNRGVMDGFARTLKSGESRFLSNLREK